MGNLVSEILLRLAKVGLVTVLGAILYVVITATGTPGSAVLELLCWVAAAAFWLLIETSPL